MSPSQSAISQWGWGFHTVWGGIHPWDLGFRRRVVELRNVEGFLIRGWNLNFPVYSGTSTLARGETLAVRWLHERQSISNHPVGLGFPHRAGRYRPVESPFSSPGCWRRKDMEGFLIWG